MRPVVGGVDDPVVGGAVVVRVTDPVHDRVAQLHVLVRHVDLGAQHLAAVGELLGPHPAEQVQVLLRRAVTVGGVDARLAEAAAACGDLLAGLVVDIGQPGLDELLGPRVELFEVVGREPLVGRFVAEPADVGHDRLDEGHVLGLGVGVVEAQHAGAAEVVCDAEVDDDGLGVPDVQVAVRLGWEPGLDPPAAHTLLDVAGDGVVYEVGGHGGIGHGDMLAGRGRRQPRVTSSVMSTIGTSRISANIATMIPATAIQ